MLTVIFIIIAIIFFITSLFLFYKALGRDNFLKFIKIISKIISWFIFAILIIAAAFLLYYFIATKIYAAKGKGYEPKFSIYTIISQSMTPNINVYDTIINIRIDNPEDIKVGDVITFISTSLLNPGTTVTHRVVSITTDSEGKTCYRTKGDYNPVEDQACAKFSNVLGKVIFVIPQLGRVQFFIASGPGWIICILIPALIIIIRDILKISKLSSIKNVTEKLNKKDNHKKKQEEEERKKALKRRLNKENSEEYYEKPPINEITHLALPYNPQNMKTSVTNKNEQLLNNSINKEEIKESDNINTNEDKSFNNEFTSEENNFENEEVTYPIISSSTEISVNNISDEPENTTVETAELPSNSTLNESTMTTNNEPLVMDNVDNLPTINPEPPQDIPLIQEVEEKLNIVDSNLSVEKPQNTKQMNNYRNFKKNKKNVYYNKKTAWKNNNVSKNILQNSSKDLPVVKEENAIDDLRFK